jgi:hypothetical protein
MAKLSKKQRLFVINNLIIFLAAAIAVPVTLIVGSRTTRLDNSPYPYWMHIVSFTLLSAIFMELVAGISAFIVLFSKMRKTAIPNKKAIQMWYLAASTASMITCLTVLFFLAPMRVTRGGNYFDPLLETMFFLHFFNPVLSAITYIFTMDKIKINWKKRIIAALPFIIYAAVYAVCVIVLKVWPDFYGLTFGGKYYLVPIVFLIFLALSYGITSLLIKLRDNLQK